MQSYARQPAPVQRNYAPVERYNQPVQAYNRSTMEAYNRTPAPISRQPAYSSPQSRLAYGPSYYNGGARATAPAQAYRAPTADYGRTTGGFHSFQASDSKSFKAYEKAEKSSGSRMFGDGYKEPKFKEPSFKEPKFKEPKMPKEKSSGGGHSSAHSSGHHW